jgi:adenosylmethionine-8-amino-7-oxononanoate aminotransferase
LEKKVSRDLGNVLHPIVPHKQLERRQLVAVAAENSTIVDADGAEYLDAMAGLWCVNIGYGRAELAAVAAEQMQALAYYPHTAMNVPAASLAEKANSLLGGDNHVYFVNSGSEANEAGFKIARQYMKQEHPGEFRYKTIGRYWAYHGTTLGTLAAGGMGERKAKFEPLGGNDFVHTAPPYCYRCPFGLSYPSCGLACAKNLETTILGEGPETVAEVIVEPIMSGVGVAVPPDEYLPEVASICRKYGVLLHVDEVINGFGRTGKMFGHQHWEVTPDIVQRGRSHWPEKRPPKSPIEAIGTQNLPGKFTRLGVHHLARGELPFGLGRQDLPGPSARRPRRRRCGRCDCAGKLASPESESRDAVTCTWRPSTGRCRYQVLAARRESVAHPTAGCRG